jgi:hypothetical protein
LNRRGATFRPLLGRIPEPSDRATWILLVAIVAVGLVPRLLQFGDGLYGDEVSTLYIVRDRGFADMLNVVSSDAEISPPLYFILAWFSTKLGSAPDLVRLPSLLAGIASIPLVYAVGAKALSRAAGLIAALAFSLSPFMVGYAVNGRVYAVAIALLLASTLAMLYAASTKRTGWWVAYGAFSCAAMYSHYTVAFVLLAQLGWLAWAHRGELRPALIANVGAAVLYLPWLPSALEDFDSPTIGILQQLQGDGFGVKRAATELWAFGYPGASIDVAPGRLLVLVAVVAIIAAAAAGLRRWWRGRPDGASRPAISRGMVLVLALALATPVAEVVMLALGTDIYGARNLNTSSGGLALAIGGILAASGPLIAAICGVAVLGTLSYSVVRSIPSEQSELPFDDVAALIETRAGDGDVVFDGTSANVSPVPLTPLDVYLDQRWPELRMFQPAPPAPFLVRVDVAPEQLDALLREADGGHAFLVVLDGSVTEDGGRVHLMIRPPHPGEPGLETDLPRGWRIAATTRFPGISAINVVELENARRAGAPGS